MDKEKQEYDFITEERELLMSMTYDEIEEMEESVKELKKENETLYIKRSKNSVFGIIFLTLTMLFIVSSFYISSIIAGLFFFITATKFHKISNEIFLNNIIMNDIVNSINDWRFNS